MSNRLADQASSYLRSAAHQPVAWHPWGEDAFKLAREQDRPILLDIGAVWCHWCHVMDRESYEDKELARLINELFIAIKVDRDERPDVDTRYQKSIQAMTGQGGWPLTGFLLPDGRCFYGGTYFPPRDAQGRPSFRRVLEAVADAYRTRREEILSNAEHLGQHFAAPPTAAPAPEDGWPALLDAAVGRMQTQFDPANGGWGGAPKFPHAAATDLLLARPDALSRDMALATLRAMREGGIYDQLAGGFHRYSVDAEWIVPHFEKMLYDNAALLRNYVRAARVSGDPTFRVTADEIKRFLRDMLQHPDGGFGGSQDADIDLDDDGDHFTWTLAELQSAIPDPKLAHVMAEHFGIREKGDMHHAPERCVLRIAADAAALAAAHHRTEEEILADIADGTDLMREARAKRPLPFVDPLRYTSWNAMTIQALLEMVDRDADAMAIRALDAFLAGAYDPERGWRRAIGSGPWGLLDDQAQMLDALLEAHLATGNPRYLEVARTTADLILAHYRHPQGGFADRADTLAEAAQTTPLARPERPIQDAPTASANGVALRALLRLADAAGEQRYREEATRALPALATEAARLALFGGATLHAMHTAIHPAPRIIVHSDDIEPYRRIARTAPGATLAGPTDPGVPPEARTYTGSGATVCLGTRCLPPADTPTELAQRLTREVAAATSEGTGRS